MLGYIHYIVKVSWPISYRNPESWLGGFLLCTVKKIPGKYDGIFKKPPYQLPISPSHNIPEWRVYGVSYDDQGF